MAVEPAQGHPGRKPSGNTFIIKILRLPTNFLHFCTSRGAWFWIPVGIVGVASGLASSLFFMGAIIAFQLGQHALLIGLSAAGVALLLSPIIIMGMILESVREWLEPRPPSEDRQE